MKKNILLIGAGAVGLVYGKHLADAGHNITFYVREKYLESLSKGTILYNMNKDKSLKKPISFNQFSLISSFDEMAQKSYDQVYLCVSSTALQLFDLKALQNALGDKTTIVMLQPSVEDFQYLTTTFPPEQIVEGMITLISYATPLATETVEQPGTAYWIPPLAPTPFSGEKDRRTEVVKTFKEGKLAASNVKSVQHKSLFPTAFLMSFLTALEACNWKFNNLKSNSALLKQLKHVIDESFTTLEKRNNIKRPFGINLISTPGVIKTLLRLAPKVMPMDIETYFEYHFMKVKDQTKLYMKNYLISAEANNVDCKNLKVFNELT